MYEKLISFVWARSSPQIIPKKLELLVWGNFSSKESCVIALNQLCAKQALFWKSFTKEPFCEMRLFGCFKFRLSNLLRFEKPLLHLKKSAWLSVSCYEHGHNDLLLCILLLTGKSFFRTSAKVRMLQVIKLRKNIAIKFSSDSTCLEFMDRTSFMAQVDTKVRTLTSKVFCLFITPPPFGYNNLYHNFQRTRKLITQAFSRPSPTPYY